jgi:hypothetical protein
MRTLCLIAVALLLVAGVLYGGTTGKIVGTAVDARTGEPLPSVNVTIPGTTMGSSTNIEGFFTILNVPPGKYRLQASLVGYRNATVVDVRVDIDQTTTQNFRMSEEAIAGEEVTVIAARPVVQKDVSASRANIEIADVTKLPVTSVVSAIGLQAGIQGMSVRGGTIDQTAFVVDGMVLRDERTNNPYTGISLSAVQDIQVQTGGFNAEYGNIRSGMVNVVTREGSKYSFNIISRYSPAAAKHFGAELYDANGYWVRPYLDDAVAWTGTGKLYEPGAWDKWTRDQYVFFEGWNSISQKSLANTNPNDDLTPTEAQQMWLWEHRRQPELELPDWDVDAGLGGPIPGMENFGNLRFFVAYRQSSTALLIPLTTKTFEDQNFQAKVTADLSGTMKLQFFGLYGRQRGTNSNNTGEPGIFSSVEGVANVLSTYTSGLSYSDARMFGDGYYGISETQLRTFGAKFTHNVSSSTFYEAIVQRYEQWTDTNPGRVRDTTKIKLFGANYWVDEAPFGWQAAPSTGITGLRMGVGMSNSRDTSKVVTYTARFDITSQLDRYNQVKAGLEYNYTDNNIRANSIDEFLPSGRYATRWHNYPSRGALYVQDKLEFEGMIANFGLRLDYLNPNGEWYTDYDPFDPAFKGAYSLGIDTLLNKEKIKPQVNLSPRLGVAFPISEDSKLFFNYGHFRQIPDPRNLFLLRRYTMDNQVAYFADPTATLPRTIAYELGYEHSLWDEYLVRVAGYYKDITNEAMTVTYTGSGINYGQYTNNRYRDQRGFEVSLYKNRGKWIQGFVNYTYAVNTAGYFGLSTYNENPVTQRQIENTVVYQEKPIPAPYARANIDFYTPPDYGPSLFGQKFFGDWRLNLVGAWAAGGYFTWTGGGSLPGIEYNVQWRNTYNINARISKNFQFGKVGFQLFADISNLLNSQFLSSYGFTDGGDWQAYMFSLHLPQETLDPLQYPQVPGDDAPGDVRKEGVAYQPMVAVKTFADLDVANYRNARPIFWVKETGKFYQWTEAGGWNEADAGVVQQTLDDKAYIDMPNQETTTFLNPRKIFFGLRLTYEF